MVGVARRVAAAAFVGAAFAAPVAAQGLLDFGKKLLEQAPQTIGKVVERRKELTGDYTEAEEREMGRAAASVLLGAAPPLRDPEVQRYVSTVGTWIALQSERPGLAWRFAVLDDATVNAFAAPGGFVFLTRGLFLLLRSEDELGGVLAHEMAHVLRRHHVEAIVARERMGLAMDLAKSAVGRGGALADLAVSASRTIYARGLDQGDEFQADRDGAVLAARAGYDPYGLLHVLVTLSSLEGSSALGLFTSTHPPVGGRIDALERVLGELSLAGEPRRTRSSALARLQGRLGG
ncbi:MAG: M48 family metalloprotease [Ectothiorhodospiraceae bacterium]|nr:M48 family metalloprotease [Chromatiales bacterium]MCP5155412.1 M48 family metalloprotease [Ectothiorhodospiraceae bacterium]